MSSSESDEIKHKVTNISHRVIQSDAAEGIYAGVNTYISRFKRARVMAKRITNTDIQSTTKAVSTTGFMATAATSTRKQPFSFSVVVNETIQKNTKIRQVPSKSKKRTSGVLTAIDNESRQSPNIATKKKFNKRIVNNLIEETSCKTKSVLNKKSENTKRQGKARTVETTNTKVKKAKYLSLKKRGRKRAESSQAKPIATETIEKYAEIKEARKREMKNIPCKFFYLGVECPENENCKYMHNGPLNQQQMNVLVDITYDNLSDHKKDLVYFCEIQKIIKNRLMDVQQNLQKRLFESSQILQKKKTASNNDFITELQNYDIDSMHLICGSVNRLIVENVEKFLQNVKTLNLSLTDKNQYLNQLHDLLQSQLKKVIKQIESNNNDGIDESFINIEDLVVPTLETNNADENLTVKHTLVSPNRDIANVCYENDNSNNIDTEHYTHCTAPDIFITDGDDFPGANEEVANTVSYSDEIQRQLEIISDSDNDLPEEEGELRIVEIVEDTSNQCTPNEMDKNILNTSAPFIQTLNSNLYENEKSSMNATLVNANNNRKNLRSDRDENSLNDFMTSIDSLYGKKLKLDQYNMPKRPCETTMASKSNYIVENKQLQSVGKDSVENIVINDVEIEVLQHQKQQQNPELQTIQIGSLNKNKINATNTNINLKNMNYSDRAGTFKRWNSILANDPRISNALKEDSVYNNLIKNIDKNDKAYSTPISSPIYVETIASPSPIRNVQLKTLYNINNYAAEINGQENYSNLEYKLYEIDIPPKETAKSLNINKMQSKSYIDPRLYKHIESASSSAISLSSPEVKQASSSLTKQQSQRKITFNKNDENDEVSSEMSMHKLNKECTNVRKSQNPNMLLYCNLQHSSWYHKLTSSAKIRVNQIILQLLKAINDFNSEYLTNPNITFDVYKLDNIHELLNIMKNLRIYVDAKGIINEQRKITMDRNRLGKKQIPYRRSNEYTNQRRITFRKNMPIHSSSIISSIPNDYNNSSSSINSASTSNSSYRNLMRINERLRHRRMENSASRGSTYNHADKYDSRSYHYSSNARKRRFDNKEYHKNEHYWRKNIKESRMSIPSRKHYWDYDNNQ